TGVRADRERETADRTPPAPPARGAPSTHRARLPTDPARRAVLALRHVLAIAAGRTGVAARRPGAAAIARDALVHARAADAEGGGDKESSGNLRPVGANPAEHQYLRLVLAAARRAVTEKSQLVEQQRPSDDLLGPCQSRAPLTIEGRSRAPEW